MVLGIYGTGGTGLEIFDLAQSINALQNKWERIVFINDFKTEPVINGVEVLTFDEFKTNLSPYNSKVVVATGEPKVRQALREKATASGYSLQTLAHPTASIGAGTQIDEGAIVQFGSFVSCKAKIGANCLIQNMSTVGHDSIIGSDTVISAFAFIGGACSVGERTYIGASVSVKEKIVIGADSIIGIGSVVLRDIPENVIAFGNPARPMKNNDRGRVFK